jgi:MFS superfamily sulfate permease-like transporter
MNAALRRTKTHWLFDYQKEWLRWDLMAGLITAAVVIPKAMAYATIAGLPVQVGLYTLHRRQLIVLQARALSWQSWSQQQ